MIKNIKKILWRKKESDLSQGEWYIGYIGDKEVAQLEEWKRGDKMDDGDWGVQVYCVKNAPVHYFPSLDVAKQYGQQTFNEFIKSSVEDTDDSPSIIIIRDVDSLVKKHGEDFVLNILMGKVNNPI